MSFQDALNMLSRDDRFRASVYAMNTLLIQKGVYTRSEFECFFTEWAENQLKEKKVSGSLQVGRS